MVWLVHSVKKLDAATKAKVDDILITLPEGHFSPRFLAACLAAYGGDEIALMTDLLDGSLPVQLKKLYLRIGPQQQQPAWLSHSHFSIQKPACGSLCSSACAHCLSMCCM